MFLLSAVLIVKASISGVTIVPSLDVSAFAPYKIKADISGSPTSVTVEVSGINGDNPSPMCWDYFIDGTCNSTSTVKTMTYNVVSEKWESANIYPDSIYPEIYFADANTTWYNTPSDLIMNRNSYQMFNFTNPFTMTDNMSFFVEINAVPRSTVNSADLEIYLVEKDVPLSFFNSDWRNSSQASLLGTIARTDVFHHSHNANSSHYLVPVSADSSGLVNGLDVSENFWIVVYNTSPNNARGWNLKYHPTCDDRGRWYQGSQAGWTTTAMSGCPDTHIHLARRITDDNPTIQDGIKAVITANYASGDPTVEISNFYFVPIPNLAPNSTSFITPVVSGTYDSNITVSWNPATDPNNDALVYDIYLLNEGGDVISTLVSATTSTSFLFDITAVDNGNYSLKGLITESGTTTPLTTDFYLGGNFTINKAVTLYDLDSISLSSNNASSTLAKAGDVITLDFSATGTTTPSVTFYSGDDNITNSVTITPSSGTDFTASYTVSALDTAGQISFDISATNLTQVYSNTTDNSSVLVDVAAPASVIASPVAGTYDTAQSVTLSSTGSDYIRYTTNGSSPSCTSGSTYSGAINIATPTTIKAIACDMAGNTSAVAEFAYAFEYTVTFNGNGGGGHTPTFKLVNYGATTTLPTAPTRTGYMFTSWNTASNGSGTEFSTTTVVMANLTVYAIWTINNYTLTYLGNGSTSGSPYDAENYNYSSTVTVKNENSLLKTGYSFYGWNTVADGSGVSYASSSQFVITSDINLYAQWLANDQCTVTFNGNGGAGHVPGTRTIDCVEYSSLVEAGLSLPSSPTRTGYTFTSWNMLANGSGTEFTATSTIDSNITVYAQWTGNEYNLSFNPQGGTVTPTSTTVVYNSAVGALPTPTKTNYTFSSWNTLADGTGANYASTTVYNLAADSTVYAQWTGAEYHINFNAQGGTVTPTSTTVVYNSAVGTLPTPTKTNYTFLNWNTAADGTGTDYGTSTVYQISGDSTLYASWRGNTHTIAFNPQGGTVAPTVKTVYYNEAVGTLPTPTKTGYTFSGWYTESNGGGSQINATTIYSFTENIPLFAKWTAIVAEEDEDTVPSSTNTAFIPAPATGSGRIDASIGMSQSGSLGQLESGGVNYLSYINSEANFQLGSQGQPENYLLKIIDLDLFNNVVSFMINNSRFFALRLGEEITIDLNSDTQADIYVKFQDLQVNRVELTLRKITSNDNASSQKLVSDVNTELIMAEARQEVVKIDSGLVSRLAGSILLQVENKGQAWYLEPVSRSRYFMGRPSDAFNLMRTFGLGAKQVDVVRFINQGAPVRLAGRIILAVEANGEAYYVNPDDLKLHYLSRPVDAFQIMQDLSLGISNDNIRKIPVGK